MWLWERKREHALVWTSVCMCVYIRVYACRCVWLCLGECNTLTWSSKNTLLFEQVCVCVGGCSGMDTKVCVYVRASVHLCERKCVCVCMCLWAKVCVCAGVGVHTWTNVCAMKKASQVLTKTKWHERSRSSFAGSYTSKKFAAGKDDFFFKKKLQFHGKYKNNILASFFNLAILLMCSMSIKQSHLIICIT